MSRVKEWRALDHCDDNLSDDATVKDDADQVQDTQQFSDEWIIIKDSEKVKVTTTDTQGALSLQASIKVAIGIVIDIAFGDDVQTDSIMQDLNQVMGMRQSNRQKTIVEKSKNVKIETDDTDIAVNIQFLFQFLFAIVFTLDIL